MSINLLAHLKKIWTIFKAQTSYPCQCLLRVELLFLSVSVTDELYLLYCIWADGQRVGTSFCRVYICDLQIMLVVIRRLHSWKYGHSLWSLFDYIRYALYPGLWPRITYSPWFYSNDLSPPKILTFVLTPWHQLPGPPPESIRLVALK